MAFQEPVLLTVRGTLVPPNLDAARSLHNDTAGSERGIAAARALGDLSHKVYAPCLRAGPLSSAREGELLFIDFWENPKGIMDFFSNSNVQEQAGKLFSARDATLWMPAQGAFSLRLQAPAGKNERYLGLLRAPIASPDKAIEALGTLMAASRRDARQRGQIAHELFVKMAPPGDSSPLELIGLDLWASFEGMQEHYGSLKMDALAKVFTGAPQATVWEQAPGNWSEW
jgi:hypothetical protein